MDADHPENGVLIPRRNTLDCWVLSIRRVAFGLDLAKLALDQLQALVLSFQLTGRRSGSR